MPKFAIQDANQVYSVVAVQGTAGTADTVGTSQTVAVGADPVTGAMYVYNLGPAGSVTLGDTPGGTLNLLQNGTVAVRPQPGADPGTALTVRLTDGTSFYNASGAGGGTSVQVEHGTVELVTTLSNLTNGSVRVTAGTIGTVAAVGQVHNAGTLAGGTLGILTDGTIRVVAGTVQSVTTVTNLTNGTIQNSGTVTGVGVVSALTTGTLGLVTTVSNLTNGTVRVTAGTVNSGTINAGTINSGTINAGTVTVQPYPASQVLAASFVGTNAVGTLVAAPGAGNGIYISSIKITPMSGTLDMCLSFGLGSTTNQVVDRGYYIAGGGVALSFPHPSFYGTANSDLTYQILSGAGTASWQVTYTTKGTP